MGTLRDFYRYSALGNDYVVIDPQKFALDLTPERIRKICHRHFGLGSDGILYGPGPRTSQGHMSLRIFNPDGSEAEKSGNGIRIFAKYLWDESYVIDRVCQLETLGGVVEVEYLDESGKTIQVHMGRAQFQTREIPVQLPQEEVIQYPLTLEGETFLISCVSMGNPHCVISPQKGRELSPELAQKWGPLLETHALFPNRTNVQFLQVLGRDRIRIEIWERGAGYTMASGSSSCAAAAVAHKLKLVDSQVTVQMPGGELNIRLGLHGDVWMKGNVQNVASGFFDRDFLRMLRA